MGRHMLKADQGWRVATRKGLGRKWQLLFKATVHYPGQTGSWLLTASGRWNPEPGKPEDQERELLSESSQGSGSLLKAFTCLQCKAGRSLSRAGHSGHCIWTPNIMDAQQLSDLLDWQVERTVASKAGFWCPWYFYFSWLIHKLTVCFICLSLMQNKRLEQDHHINSVLPPADGREPSGLLSYCPQFRLEPETLSISIKKINMKLYI